MATSTPVPSVPAVSQVLAPVSVTPSDCSAGPQPGKAVRPTRRRMGFQRLACAWRHRGVDDTPSISPITVPPAVGRPPARMAPLSPRSSMRAVPLDASAGGVRRSRGGDAVRGRIGEGRHGGARARHGGAASAAPIPAKSDAVRPAIASTPPKRLSTVLPRISAADAVLARPGALPAPAGDHRGCCQAWRWAERTLCSRPQAASGGRSPRGTSWVTWRGVRRPRPRPRGRWRGGAARCGAAARWPRCPRRARGGTGRGPALARGAGRRGGSVPGPLDPRAVCASCRADGQAGELDAGERGQLAPHAQRVVVDLVGGAEAAAAVDRPEERRVRPGPGAEPELGGGEGEVELDSRRGARRARRRAAAGATWRSGRAGPSQKRST